MYFINLHIFPHFCSDETRRINRFSCFKRYILLITIYGDICLYHSSFLFIIVVFCNKWPFKMSAFIAQINVYCFIFVWNSGMKIPHYLHWCHHLRCCYDSISSVVPSGHLQVSEDPVNLQEISKIMKLELRVNPIFMVPTCCRCICYTRPHFSPIPFSYKFCHWHWCPVVKLSLCCHRFTFF